MSIRKAAVATMVAFSMVAMPTVVQAAQANQTAVSKLSVARSGAVTKKQNELAGGSLILVVLAVAAVIAGIVIASDGGSKSP
jgi:hypothetical protein